MIKRTMLVVATAALAFVALPALAAADPKMELPAEKHFTVSGGETKLTTTDGSTITCTSGTGSGVFVEETIGTIQLTFHSCKESTFGFTCTSPGESNGTITTPVLPFHLQTITGNETQAVLITPNNPNPKGVGHFATFNCTFLIHVEVTGTGLIGDITEPYGTESATFTMNLESASEGHQKHTLVDHNARVFDLHSSKNGGAAITSSLDNESTLHFTEGKGILTHGTTTP